MRLRPVLLKILAPIAAIFLMVAPVAAVHAAQFGLDETIAEVEKKQGTDFKLVESPATIIGRLISAALGLVGIIFFVLMVYAGFLWMTARGNEKTTAKAKEAIVSAVIGLVIVAGAYAITNLIFKGVTPQAAPAAAPKN
jgi:hypothetical protein